MKSISAIHPAITENTENMLVKCTPHISIRESHNVLISAIPNSFHNIVSMRSGSASAIFMTRTEAIMCLPQIVTLCDCEERMGGTKEYKGSTMMQAM